MESQSVDAIKDKLKDLFEVEKPSVDGVRIVIRGPFDVAHIDLCRGQSAEGQVYFVFREFHGRRKKSQDWTQPWKQILCVDH